MLCNLSCHLLFSCRNHLLPFDEREKMFELWCSVSLTRCSKSRGKQFTGVWKQQRSHKCNIIFTSPVWLSSLVMNLYEKNYQEYEILDLIGERNILSTLLIISFIKDNFYIFLHSITSKLCIAHISMCN